MAHLHHAPWFVRISCWLICMASIRLASLAHCCLSSGTAGAPKHPQAWPHFQTEGRQLGIEPSLALTLAARRSRLTLALATAEHHRGVEFRCRVAGRQPERCSAISTISERKAAALRLAVVCLTAELLKPTAWTPACTRRRQPGYRRRWGSAAHERPYGGRRGAHRWILSGGADGRRLWRRRRG